MSLYGAILFARSAICRVDTVAVSTLAVIMSWRLLLIVSVRFRKLPMRDSSSLSLFSNVFSLKNKFILACIRVDICVGS